MPDFGEFGLWSPLAERPGTACRPLRLSALTSRWAGVLRPEVLVRGGLLMYSIEVLWNDYSLVEDYRERRRVSVVSA